MKTTPPGLRTAVSGVQYSYDLQLQVYTKSPDGSVVRSDTTELMQELIAQYMGTDMANRTARQPKRFPEQPVRRHGAVDRHVAGDAARRGRFRSQPPAEKAV